MVKLVRCMLILLARLITLAQLDLLLQKARRISLTTVILTRNHVPDTVAFSNLSPPRQTLR